jgi:hypothetical protein
MIPSYKMRFYHICRKYRKLENIRTIILGLF